MSGSSAANDSDYGEFGSDAEELAIIDRLLEQAAPGSSDASLFIIDIEDYEAPHGLRLPKHSSQEATSTQSRVDVEVLRHFQTASAGVRSPKRVQRQSSVEAPKEDGSPLERFRKPPKKALSVTDLVSPAWCELQYFYTLTKHGKKRRTPAMKQGSAVHQALEDEIHVTVPIDILKVEDSFGLRIWNIIQGLRTLRDTGRTRELEVWGTIGGELVNGVIDELSYECPNPRYEEGSTEVDNPLFDLPEYQTSITEYLLAAGQKETGQPIDKALHSRQEMKAKRNIYITDMKTRNTATLPAGSAVRPTILQLHLYHHMLENLAQGNFHLSTLTERYGLNPHEIFSDSFLAQLGNLNQDINIHSDSSQDSVDIVLQHNTLSSLWEYMMSRFRLTFFPQNTHGDTTTTTTTNEPLNSTPQSTSDLLPPPTNPTLLSPLLTAEYLSPHYKHEDGTTGKRSLGRKSFGFNPAFLKSYLQDSLAWWHGQREARGVELHEAWKCRSCDFRDDCAWIHERDAAAFEDAMQRKATKEAIVGGGGGGSNDSEERKRRSRSQV